MLKKIYHQTQRKIAKIWLKLNPKMTIIGVTGSYGKTSTVRAISQVLSEKFKTLQTDLNLDTNYNLPMTLLKIRPWHQKLVLEYGVDHRGEMNAHLNLVKPSVAVVTGINPTHSEPELLGSEEGVIKEKAKLLQALPKNGLAVLNWDDEKVRRMATKVKAKILKYGLKAGKKNENDLWASGIKVDFKGTTAIFHFNYLSQQKEALEIKTGLVGRHFIQPCLAATAVGLSQGLSFSQIKKGLAKLKPLPGRLSVEKGPCETVLLNDYLRANPASTLAGLQTLSELSHSKTRSYRMVAVLGEMGELGESAEKEHQKIGQEVAKLKIDYLVSVGALQKLTAQQAIKFGLKENQVFWAKDVFQAAQILKKILKKGDLFYLKGSRLKHMERVLLILEDKKVGCRVASCHLYHSCGDCPYLKSGLSEAIIKKHA